jgi:hypothetical protein
VIDDGPSGSQRYLWALPSEELPPGAAVFLDMARDLQAGLSDSAAWIEADDQELAASVSGDPAELADPRPSLRLVGSPGEDAGAPMEPDDEAGARVFLEMVDRTGTVRPMMPGDTGAGQAIPDWLWSVGEEGIPAAEVLLSTIEAAIRHVNHSEDIRSEEVRRRLLDLFTDFAVRRPWKEEERPAAQRIQRLGDQPRDEREGRG